MPIQYFDLKVVKIAKENPRKSRSKERVAILAASLADVGLIHSLAGYTENGYVHITAGGTRIDALRLLMKEVGAKKRTVNADLYTKIPVNVEAKEKAIEIALSSNELVTAMTLAEQFTAYNALHKQGVTPEEIATRYFTEAGTVKRMLALANLHKPIFKAFEKGEIELDVAKAYAGTSQARQSAVWGKLGTDARAWQVRETIRENTFNADDKFVKFIGGVEAYEAKGGVIEADLFSDKTVLCNGDIVSTLFDEAVKAFEAKFTEDGWANVVYTDNMGWEAKEKLTKNIEIVKPVFKPDAKTKKRHDKDLAAFKVLAKKENDSELTKREHTRMESLEASIAHIRELCSSVPVKHRAVGTVLWSIRHDGETHVAYYKPKGKVAAAAKKAEKAVNYPASFVENVNRTAGQALMDGLVANPNKTAMCMALALLDRVAGGGVSASLSNVRALKYQFEGYTSEDREFEWNDPSEKLATKVLELEAMSQEELNLYSARMLRRGFDAGMMGTLESGREDIRDIYTHVSKSCDFNLGDYWLMGEDELKSLNKTQLLRCMEEIGFDVSAYTKSKKSELVKIFATYVQRTKWTPDFVRTHEPIVKTDTKEVEAENQEHTSQAANS